MKTIKQVEITPVFVEFIPEEVEQGKLYISYRYSTASHLCLCGCNNLVVTPLIDNFWTITEHNGDRVSISPSIGNYNLPCKSHYIITKNKANFI